MLAEWDAGVLISPVDPEFYSCPMSLEKLGLPLADEDQTVINAATELVERGSKGGAGHGAYKHLGRQKREVVSWLRKPEYVYLCVCVLRRVLLKVDGVSVFDSRYLTNDVYTRVHNFKSISDSVEQGAHLRRSSGNSAEVLTVEQRVKDIIASFGGPQVPTHPLGKDLKPVAVTPIFPDVNIWANDYLRVAFDVAPLTLPRAKDLPPESLLHGVLKPYGKEEKSHIGFLLPEKICTDDDHESSSKYRWVTEYLCNVRDQRSIVLCVPDSLSKAEHCLDPSEAVATYAPLQLAVTLEKLSKYVK